ncbi:Rv3654c family TadE-like protein [Streptomyces sp. NPDC018045]|uniref:Rv3654c family TadE-like protein n=1 Tax=Streptomyces sp. NPDC018045 TaxID=3365037 RepID=UPI00379109B2
MWAVFAALALCTVFAVLIGMAQVVVARHRAGGAADLAALAAADTALRGAAAACRTAREVAAAQDAHLVRCTVRGEIADVTARARTGPFASDIRARAGPPTTGPGAEPIPEPGGSARESPQVAARQEVLPNGRPPAASARIASRSSIDRDLRALRARPGCPPGGMP